MKVNVEFEFLGNRNYIHSTSWIYKLLEILKEHKYIQAYEDINKINAVFREKKNKQGYYLIDEVCKNADILFDVYTGSGKIRACYIEEGEKVLKSINYDEDGIVGSCIIDKESQSSSLQIESFNNIYNLIVALNKKMLLELLDNNGYTSWSVGKFSINWHVLHNNSLNQQLRVQLINNIDNMYCKSNIYVCNELAGNIDFARKRIDK